MRAYLTKPSQNLRLVNLSSYSPDFNPDQAIWGWARQEMTANLCLGTRAAVRESVGGFSLICPTDGKKSSGHVAPSFKLAPQDSPTRSKPILLRRQM